MEKTPWLPEALGRFFSVLKMLLIGILILLFLIPLGLIRQIVQERDMSRNFAENEVMAMWGGEQTVAGPFLTVPYVVRRKDAHGRVEEATAFATRLWYTRVACALS